MATPVLCPRCQETLPDEPGDDGTVVCEICGHRSRIGGSVRAGLTPAEVAESPREPSSEPVSEEKSEPAPVPPAGPEVFAVRPPESPGVPDGRPRSADDSDIDLVDLSDTDSTPAKLPVASPLTTARPSGVRIATPPIIAPRPKSSGGALAAGLIVGMFLFAVVAAVGGYVYVQSDSAPEPLAAATIPAPDVPATRPAVVPETTTPPSKMIVPEPPPKPPEANLNDLITDLVRSDAAKTKAARAIALLGTKARPAVPALLNAAKQASPEARAAIASALLTVGPPLPGEELVLVPALDSDVPAVRRYALLQYNGPVTVPRGAFPALAGLLDNADAETREAAVRALGKAGLAAKPAALAGLLARLGDDDPKVAALAKTTLEKFRPWEHDDLDELGPALKDGKPPTRAFAASAIADLELDENDVSKYWAPLLDDPDPAVRVRAVREVSRFPVVVDRSANMLGKIAENDDLSTDLRTAAVRALGESSLPILILPRLEKLASSTTDAGVRTAAAEAIAELATGRSTETDALLTAVKYGGPKAQTTALNKMRDGKLASKSVVDTAVERLKSPDADVQVAALQVLGGAGEAAEGAVPDVRGLVTRATTGRADQAVTAAALTALSKLGTKGATELIAADFSRMPAPVLAHVCTVLTEMGDKAAPAIPLLVEAGSDDPAVRTAVATAARKIDGNRAVTEFIERTKMDAVIRGGRKVEQNAEDVRVWAVTTLGEIDPTKLSAGSREKLTERLEYMAKFGRTPADRDSATAALRRVAARGGR